MQQDHENPLCASLGHFVGGVQLAWCPHYQGWTLMVRAGDESDDTAWRWDRITFGPFDSQEDVEREAVAELLRVLRADRSGWAATQKR